MINGKIKVTVSDVFVSEVPKVDNIFMLPENFIATLHIGGSTKECLKLVGNAVVDNLFAVMYKIK